jgi:hypothetical protein
MYMPQIVLSGKPKKPQVFDTPIATVDPRTIPPKAGVPMDRYETGIDPTAKLKTMDATQMMRTHIERAKIRYGGGKHELTEIFAFVLFPKKEEKLFAWIYLWTYRDAMGPGKIAKLTGIKRKMVDKYLAYIHEVSNYFVQRTNMGDKLEVEPGDLMTEAERLELDVREIIDQ